MYDVDRHCVLLFKTVLVRGCSMHPRKGLVISVQDLHRPVPLSPYRHFIKITSKSIKLYYKSYFRMKI